MALALVTWRGTGLAQSDNALPEQLRSIASVGFEGLHRLGHRELKGANLKTRRPSHLPWKDRPSLRLDYLRADTAAIATLYRHYGFLDVRVGWRLAATADPHAARVLFVIDEGQRSRVGAVTFAGVSALRERDLRRALLAQPGRAFDPAFLPLDTLKLSRLYQERGYLPHTLARAQRGRPESLAVAVHYDVVEGPRYVLGTITYHGGGTVRENLGRRELLVRPGDVYRRSRIEQSVERLYGTGLFSQVQVSPTPDSVQGRIDLDLRVAERRARWFDAGVGSGSSDRFRVSGQWGHRNLDTHALRGELDGDFALDGRTHFRKASTSASLTKPWLLGVRLLGQVRGFYERIDDRVHAVADARRELYVQRRDARGVELNLYREFSRLFRGTLTARQEDVHQSYEVLDDTLGQVTRDSLAAAVVPRYRSNRLALTLQRDMRDDRISPSLGSLQSIVAELAGGPLRGQSSYRKLQLTSVWYTPLRNGWTLAARASGGVMEPTGDRPDNFSVDARDEKVGSVPRESRFFVGGPNSLRGYGESAIPTDGGLAMVLGNVELRMPVWGPLGIEVFVDAGNVWSRPEYVTTDDFVPPWSARVTNDGDLRYTYGVGTRLVLPFGPLRVDLAWSERPDFPRATVFGKGQRFAYQFAIGPTF